MVRITINGNVGSGKSTLGRYISEKMGLNRYGMGDLRRKMAADKGMTLAELNKLGEKEAWTDREVDDYQKNVLSKEDNFVIDGRLGWFFIPDSIKVFLDVDPRTGAERIFNDMREEERTATVDDMIKMNQERRRSDIKRYNQLYGVNPYDKENYEIIIDTSDMEIDPMKEIVLNVIKKYMKDNNLK